MFTFLPEKYASPRWSWEYIDCSMPMTFDTYSNCGYGCLYCFSTFQRSIGKPRDNYVKKQVKRINVDKVKRMFSEPDKFGWQFKDYIKWKYVLQWGWLSDPMCPIEEDGWAGLEMMQFFNDIEYPVRFSSKSDLILRDDRYLKEFARWKDRFAYMASIITYDEQVAKRIEAWVPTPQRRMEVLKTLSDVWVWTVLRLRPYIIGVTDRTIKDTINAAWAAGVKACSTEFFCVESRSTPEIRRKFKGISDECWFDIFEMYRQHSNTNWYMRLSKKFTQPYMDELKKLCDKNNILLASSDPKHKEVNFSNSCCGLPNAWVFAQVHRGQYLPAINLAKIKWYVTWDDLEKVSILKDVKFWQADGLNQWSWKLRARYWDLSISDKIKEFWNNPKSANSPYKLFEWLLEPKWVDQKWNIIYLYKWR